jgi:hypothetical protein
MSGWRRLLLLPAVAALWVLASLYLRVDLPGASELAWAVFSGVVFPLRQLDLPGPQGLLAGGAAALVLALAARRFAALRLGLDLGLGLALVAPLAVVVALGLLMERPAAIGMAVALALAVRSGLHDAPRYHHPSTQGRLVVISLIVASVVGAIRYVLLLTRTEPGYPLLEWAGQQFRHGIITPGFAFGTAAVVALVCLSSVLASRPGGIGRVGSSAAGAIAAGLAVTIALRPAFADQSALWPSLLSISLAVLLVPVLGPYCRSVPSAWPLLRGGLHLALVPVLCAGLLVVQAYCTRILHCPTFDSNSPLERIAVIPDTFRIALDAGGEKALLTIRESGHLASIALSPEIGAPVLVDPGPARCHPLADQAPMELVGPPEELVFVPGPDRFFGVVVTPSLAEGGQFLLDSIPHSKSCTDPDDFGSLLIRLSEDASRVERAYTLPGLCWVSTVEWDPRDELLLLGWEYSAGLHRHNLQTGWSEGYALDPGIGDVSGLAIDPSPDRDRLYSVSLWAGANLTQLARSDLVVRGEETLDERGPQRIEEETELARQRIEEMADKLEPLLDRLEDAAEQVDASEEALAEITKERDDLRAEQQRLERKLQTCPPPVSSGADPELVCREPLLEKIDEVETALAVVEDEVEQFQAVLNQHRKAQKVAKGYVDAISANKEGAAADLQQAKQKLEVARGAAPLADEGGEGGIPSQGSETQVGPSPRTYRQLSTQGVNYDVALDSARDRLYISSYYSSVVQVVDAESLTQVGTIPTGLGTRALQIVHERDLLLISSVYDGTVRVWDLAEDRLLAALPVGGHVKNFAVSPGGETAYFWSQCGLLSLDLGALQRAGEGT